MKTYRISNIFRGRVKKCFLDSIVLLLIVSLTAMPAGAQSSSFVAHVTAILNSQGGPSSFDFGTDNTPSACNGAIFYFASGADEPSKIANYNALYATVLAAYLSGRPVYMGVNNPSGGFNYCTLVFFNPTS